MEGLRTFLDRRRNVLGEPRTEHANAMPLRLRRPLVVGVLPRPLRRDGKNGEFVRSMSERSSVVAKSDRPED